MTHPRARRRRSGAKHNQWTGILKGLGAAILTTLAGVALFALVMQWVKPTEDAVRIFNQVLKLLSIAIGVWTASGPGSGLLRGAAIGLAYMALGVAAYAFLSGQQAPLTSYLADLGMGVAGGGIVGLIRDNFFNR